MLIFVAIHIALAIYLIGSSDKTVTDVGFDH